MSLRPARSVQPGLSLTKEPEDLSRTEEKVAIWELVLFFFNKVPNFTFSLALLG